MNACSTTAPPIDVCTMQWELAGKSFVWAGKNHMANNGQPRLSQKHSLTKGGNELRRQQRVECPPVGAAPEPAVGHMPAA